MANYIITFGQEHTHSVNGITLDKDCVAVIEAPEHSSAHDRAMHLFNGVFHNCTPEKVFDESDRLKHFPRGKIKI